MFNDNVTQTYNFADASQEILIMLLGAFLLGCILTWLLNKLFNKEYSVEKNSTNRYKHQNTDDINSLKQIPTLQAETTSEVRVVSKPTNPIKTAIAVDDLTKISGVTNEMQSRLKEIGISSFVHLRDISTKNLTSFQQEQQSNRKEIETWPHQASLAAKGDWGKLTDYQGFIQRVQTASSATSYSPKEPTNQKKNEGSDDLTQIIGVSAEMENILNKKKISTFKQLSYLDGDTLKKHILDADSSLVETETESWPHQAAMADKGQWEELKIYQDFMHSDSDLETEKPSVKIQSTDHHKNTNVPTLIKNEEINNNEEINTNSIDQNQSDHDDFKKIDGIGPKIEEVLNNGGIYTFSQLYNSDRARLRQLLDDAGSQFTMHDPESWPHQAGMANRSEWNELKSYQNSLNRNKDSLFLKTKNDETGSKTDSKKTNKLTIAHQKDDLRKIEGIGPKIQELLNNAGIYSYKALSVQSRDFIKELLNEAGPQFRMHEPESWPHQAKLASKNEWKELKEYQDFLISGRE